MWRALVSVICLLALLPGLPAFATATAGGYHWFPGFYKAGIVADGAPYTFAGVYLTCEPIADRASGVRLVVDGLAADAGAPTPPALDIDIDDRRFRVLATHVVAEGPSLVVPADPAVIGALTRGRTLTLGLPGAGRAVSYDLEGAAAAIADMIGDCAEFTPDWCARRIVLLGRPARAGASAIREDHRQAIVSALRERHPGADFDAERSLGHSCSAYYDLNNDGQSELLLYLRADGTTVFGFHVFSGVNGDFREVLHEEVFSPRFVVWSFVPARWGGWLDLVTQDVQLAPATEPGSRMLIGHIFTWAGDLQAYRADWVNQTPCLWPHCDL